MRADVGYPDERSELAVIRLDRRGVDSPTLDRVRQVLDPETVARARGLVDATTVSEQVAAYVVAIVRATRTLPGVSLGASPRASVHLLAAAKAAARLADRDFVTPDDVAAMAGPVLRHRLVLTPEAELERFGAGDAVNAALASVAVPR
ncbi:MAG: MoxR family ATPase [Actinomycetota bacterium]|nr:MoxR family ATPase [Actinomycetota bacterium]